MCSTESSNKSLRMVYNRPCAFKHIQWIGVEKRKKIVINTIVYRHARVQNTNTIRKIVRNYIQLIATIGRIQVHWKYQIHVRECYYKALVLDGDLVIHAYARQSIDRRIRENTLLFIMQSREWPLHESFTQTLTHIQSQCIQSERQQRRWHQCKSSPAVYNGALNIMAIFLAVLIGLTFVTSVLQFSFFEIVLEFSLSHSLSLPFSRIHTQTWSPQKDMLSPLANHTNTPNIHNRFSWSDWASYIIVWHSIECRR